MENLNLVQAWAEVHVETFMFYILALLAIPCALGVILEKAVIRSGFILIGVFGTICGLFLLLQAQFLALAQLMIYAVGITLVVVIALMLTGPQVETQPTPILARHKTSALLISFLIFLTVYGSLRSETFPLRTEAVSLDNVEVLGKALTTVYALPFEFASVLLVAALIGAIMLAKAEPFNKADENKETINDATS